MRPVVDLLEILFPQSESANPSSPEVPPLLYVSLILSAQAGVCSKYPITLCRPAHRNLNAPADAQNLASSEAVKAMLHLTHKAANCSLATKEQYAFCTRGSGVFGHTSCSRTTPGPGGMRTCFGFTNFLIAGLFSDSLLDVVVMVEPVLPAHSILEVFGWFRWINVSRLIIDPAIRVCHSLLVHPCHKNPRTRQKLICTLIQQGFEEFIPLDCHLNPWIGYEAQDVRSLEPPECSFPACTMGISCPACMLSQ